MTEQPDTAPKPKPVPTPGKIRLPRENKPVAPVRTPDFSAALPFGRVDEEGRVWVKDGEAERQIGQFPAEVPENPLNIYVRRYLDIAAQISLFAERLPRLAEREIDQTMKSLREQVREPAAVGDLPALREKVAQLQEKADKRKEEAARQRAEAKEDARKSREQVVVRAEEIAAQDSARTQWKHSGQELRDLLDEWKRLQHAGPRIDRGVEDELWKRFAAARSTFDKKRRAFFTELDATQAQAKAAKEKLIAEAEALSDSTNWGETTRAYRDLMTRWKAAGRASRREDDALWQRFHRAQQKFFDARNAQNEAVSALEGENLAKKEALLVKAETLKELTDVDEIKSRLRPLQEQWDEIGHVPRADIDRVERRMRAVEDHLRGLEEEIWRKSNPETKARAEGMAGQLKDLIDQIKAEIAQAEADGDSKKAEELQESLKAREAWLKQVESF
ncbi:DUF349 domain-containing protein [Varibaculum cambriense]|uniref:DUF349 domain-containing protein n=1 Tax=uncultured Varibaculum sp. TaxID=413896 RepID=UPI000C7A31DC|nr:DUF349 domain-containing protein [uncultured Varibaculum sp.]WIK89404.1 DUF349 domain-containing protein [Varibaculum cambriense]